MYINIIVLHRLSIFLHSHEHAIISHSICSIITLAQFLQHVIIGVPGEIVEVYDTRVAEEDDEVGFRDVQHLPFDS